MKILLRSVFVKLHWSQTLPKQLLGVGLIWLCSSTISQAETTQFVCDDWEGNDAFNGEYKTFEGTLFIGKKTDKGYTIRE